MNRVTAIVSCTAVLAGALAAIVRYNQATPVVLPTKEQIALAEDGGISVAVTSGIFVDIKVGETSSLDAMPTIGSHAVSLQISKRSLSKSDWSKVLKDTAPTKVSLIRVPIKQEAAELIIGCASVRELSLVECDIAMSRPIQERNVAISRLSLRDCSGQATRFALESTARTLTHLEITNTQGETHSEIPNLPLINQVNLTGVTVDPSSFLSFSRMPYLSVAILERIAIHETHFVSLIQGSSAQMIYFKNCDFIDIESWGADRKVSTGLVSIGFTGDMHVLEMLRLVSPASIEVRPVQ